MQQSVLELSLLKRNENSYIFMSYSITTSSQNNNPCYVNPLSLPSTITVIKLPNNNQLISCWSVCIVYVWKPDISHNQPLKAQTWARHTSFVIMNTQSSLFGRSHLHLPAARNTHENINVDSSWTNHLFPQVWIMSATKECIYYSYCFFTVVSLHEEPRLVFVSAIRKVLQN